MALHLLSVRQREIRLFQASLPVVPYCWQAQGLSYTIIDNRYKNRGDLFEGLSIWDEKSPDGDYAYRKLQGTYPVISLSFAKIKETSYQNTRKRICQIITKSECIVWLSDAILWKKSNYSPGWVWYPYAGSLFERIRGGDGRFYQEPVQCCV